jgi:hypothetical protein
MCTKLALYTRSHRDARSTQHKITVIYSIYLRKLTAGRSGDGIPVGARFYAHVLTGPGAYPASYTMGTGSLPGVKRLGRGVDHPLHLAPKLKKK